MESFQSINGLKKGALDWGITASLYGAGSKVFFGEELDKHLAMEMGQSFVAEAGASAATPTVFKALEPMVSASQKLVLLNSTCPVLSGLMLVAGNKFTNIDKKSPMYIFLLQAGSSGLGDVAKVPVMKALNMN